MSVAVPPQGPHRLPALDVLRAVGAAAVVGIHVGFNTGAIYQGTWGGLLARLDVGVAIFFVLSGFLLFRPFADAAAQRRGRPDVGRYLARRALRILPAYWITVVVCLALLPTNVHVTAEDWARYGTLTQVYAPGFFRYGLVQTWSLATEASFYLVLPLLAMLALVGRWRPRRVALVIGGIPMLGSVAWLGLMGLGVLPEYPHANWLPTYGIWFGAGMVLATMHVALRTGTAPARWRLVDDLAAAPVTCWAIALGLFAIAGTPITGGRDIATFNSGHLAVRVGLFTAVAVMLLLPAAFGPENRFKDVLAAPVLRWLGTVSYGMFLWHPFVLEILYFTDERPLFSGGFVGVYLLTFAGGLVLATLSYYLVEQPVLRWGVRGSWAWLKYRRQPQRAQRERADGLRADVGVPAGAGQREDAGAGHEDHRAVRLEHA